MNAKLKIADSPHVDIAAELSHHWRRAAELIEATRQELFAAEGLVKVLSGSQSVNLATLRREALSSVPASKMPTGLRPTAIRADRQLTSFLRTGGRLHQPKSVGAPPANASRSPVPGLALKKGR